MTQRNQDVLRRVADRIETTPEQYDQQEWFAYEGAYEAPDRGEPLTECGSVACIAGWAVHETTGVAPEKWERAGAEALGLTRREAALLFYEGWLPAGWEPEDTPAMVGKRAAEALRRLADGARIEDVTKVPDDDEDDLVYRLLLARETK